MTDTRSDSDTALDEGIDFALEQLCQFLGVDPADVSWDAATETTDGDVRSVIGNILRAKFGEDWGPNTAAQGAPETCIDCGKIDPRDDDCPNFIEHPTQGGAKGEAVAWPAPKVTNPDIASPTGVPYIDCLIDRVLDAQQDINHAANEGMNQSLCDASALLDEVETALRMAALSPQAQAGETDQECEDRLMKQDAADNLRLLDYIADKIGLPHNEELSRENFNAWMTRIGGAAQAAPDTIPRAEFEIVRSASRMFEDAANLWMERALKAEAAAPQPTTAAYKAQEPRLGDIVQIKEGTPYFHDWRGVELKLVSLRIDPQGGLWASLIDNNDPGNGRHRQFGVYDGETTDFEFDHLEKASSVPSTNQLCSCKASHRDGQHMAWCPAVSSTEGK